MLIYGRPHRQWVDDVIDWCKASVQGLSQYSAKSEPNGTININQGTVTPPTGAKPKVNNDDNADINVCLLYRLHYTTQQIYVEYAVTGVFQCETQQNMATS